MSGERVAVIGAGIAGLVAAVDLAVRGLEVTVFERARTPGGKMREADVAGARIDAGPTVLTMRPVFERIFAEAGGSLDEAVRLHPAETLARHAWGPSERLDLFADRARSEDAIGRFAGAAEARGYRRFCEHARRVYELLERPFIFSPRPSVDRLVGGVGLRGLGGLWQMRPFDTMWRTLGDFFADPRLRQLFGRYATYCGSSPFAAPATLVLIAHVEQEGVWLVEGGMHRLAAALVGLGERRGVTYRWESEVSAIAASGGGVEAITLASGERVPVEAVVLNADISALGAGRFGRDVAYAAPATAPEARSLSALTWALVAEVDGFPLLRHSVFFSDDYPAEFDDLVARRRLPRDPTVYVCAQDRDDRTGSGPDGPERLFALVNAPATGDTHDLERSEITACEERAFGLLRRCGLEIRRRPERTVLTTPRDFEGMFPATGGALYGPASHGWKASFARSGSASRLPGLYLAGGSTHPGPGVPMAAMSGRLAAARLLKDRASTARSRRTATRGGTSTR